MMVADFPNCSSFQVLASASNNDTSLSRSPFLHREDQAILSKVHSVDLKNTWLQLALKIRRPYEMTKSRYYYYLRPEILSVMESQNLSFDLALNHVYRSIGKKIKAGGERDAAIMKKEWNPAMDERLIGLVRKMGPCFNLFLKDFPGSSAKDIRSRWGKVAFHHFLPEEDKIILKHFTGVLRREEVHKYLPMHSTQAISRRRRLLMSYRFLSPAHIQELSLGIAKHGRGYFYMVDKKLFKDWSISHIATEWSCSEPVDQINPIWTKERDTEILELYGKGNEGKPKEFFGSEVKGRLYYLSRLDAKL